MRPLFYAFSYSFCRHDLVFSLRSVGVICYLRLPRRAYYSKSSTKRFPPHSFESESVAFHKYCEETVHVPVGGSGYISLSILRLSQVEPQTVHPNVILYLPPGHVFQHYDAKIVNRKTILGRQNGGNPESKMHPERDTGLSPQCVLAASALATVVTVNYRLGNAICSFEQDDAVFNRPPRQSHKYPTPVHDTLAGLDWILENLRPQKLCIFGRHVGGSLALMLALTEPRSVYAIATLEPICDWVGLDNYCAIDPRINKMATNLCDPNDKMNEECQVQVGSKLLVEGVKERARNKPSRAPTPPPDLVHLLKAREELFATPNKYFDSFASPILFLRSPGKDCPKAFPEYLTGPEYPTPVLKRPSVSDEPVDLWDTCMPQEVEGCQSGENQEADAKPIRESKALLRWPPFGLDYGSSGMHWWHLGIRRLQVTLPWVRIFVHRDQKEVENDNHSSAGSQGLDHKHTSPTNTDPVVRNQNKGQNICSRQDRIITKQAEEMVSVMRRACFCGREKGLGEKRVTLVPLSPSQMSGTPTTAAERDSLLTSNEKSHPSLIVEAEAGTWFRGVLESERADTDTT